MTHVPTQGPKLDAIVLERVLSHIFKRNETLSEKGSRGTPICIWGTHGLGKTEIVQDYAASRGWATAVGEIEAAIKWPLFFHPAKNGLKFGAATATHAFGRLASIFAVTLNLGVALDHRDSGWNDGNDGMTAAGRFSVGNLVLRARERLPPHQWGTLSASLISQLELILAERQPKLDWRRMVRIFCASSGRTKIRHTIKRISKRFGTRPGIKIQRESK